MPEGRILLKRISTSRKMAALKTDGARLLYSWLIPHLDINGCFSADPAVIRGAVFTRLNKSLKAISEYLENLQQEKLILIYKTNGDYFLCVPDFTEKQPKLNPDREADPSIPPPTKDQLNTYSGVTPELFETNSPISKVKESKVNIIYENGVFLNISDDDTVNWKQAYPAVDVELSIKQAAEWLKSNPDRAKKNNRRFLTNWFARTQERGGNKTHKSTGKQTIKKCSFCPNPATTEIQTGRGVKQICGTCKKLLDAAPNWKARGGYVIPKTKLEPQTIEDLIQKQKAVR